MAHEASGTSTWDGDDVRHYCRPVSDKQLLERIREYDRFIDDGTTDHTCGACGCRGGKRFREVDMDFMWAFRLPDPKQVHDSDPSQWAEFCREEMDSLSNNDFKQVEVARLKRDMITTTVLTDGTGSNRTIYHLNEKGINTDTSHKHTCNLCQICYEQINTLGTIKSEAIKKCVKEGIHVDDNTNWFCTSKPLLEPMLTRHVGRCPHDEGTFMLKAPGNTYLKFDPGRRLNMYIDDNNQRQQVPKLTELEQTALGLSVVSMSIDKWSSTSIKKGPIKVRGHCIVFPVSIQDGFKRQTCLPRRDLPDWHRILYTGAPKTFSETLAGRLNVTKWAMRYSRVRKALISLKQTHPLYKNIQILSEKECEWNDQQEKMLGHTWRVCSEDVAKRDEAIGSDVTLPVTTEGKSYTADTDIVSWDTLMVTDLGVGSEDEADALLRAATFGKSTIGDTPLNEFRDTPRIISGSFPTLFPLGIRPCDWGGDGPPGVTLTKRLLKLDDGRVANCPKMLIHLGNMKMRRESLKGVKMKVKHAKASKVLKLINHPDFDDDLAEARKNPNSSKRSKILKILKPIVELCGRYVPWGPFERQNATSHMYALVHHFGYPSMFVTFSPKAEFNRTVLKFSELQTVEDGWSPVHKVDVQMPPEVTDRLRNMSSNPVAQARAYKLIMKGVVSFLFGMDPAGKESRKTKEPKVGIFGRCNAYYGVTETQKRNGLHGHFLLWLKALDPRLIQRVSNNKELLTHIISLIDSVCVGSASGFDKVHERTSTAVNDIRNGRNPVTDRDTRTGSDSQRSSNPKRIVVGLNFYHRHVGGSSLPYNGWMKVIDRPSTQRGHHWVCCFDDTKNKPMSTIPGYESWNGPKDITADGFQCVLWKDVDIQRGVEVGDVYTSGHEMMRRFNIHSRDPHSRSCHKRKHAYDGKYCRMCFPRPSNCVTELVHLVNTFSPTELDDRRDDDNGLKVEVGTVKPVGPLPCRDKHPWDPDYFDHRVISLDMKRRWSRQERKPVVDRNAMMLYRGIQVSPNTTRVQRRNIVSHVISFLHGPKSGTDDNVLCETSPPLAKCTKCNSNVQVLGGLQQAKGAMFYLTSYLSKNPVRPEHWITCTSAARTSSLYNTSTAEDVDSNPLRPLIFFIQKVVNRLHGNIEVADTQLASLLLGMDSYSSSHDFQYCYVWPSVHYQIRKSLCLDDDDNSDDDDDDGKQDDPEHIDRGGGFKDVYEIPDNMSSEVGATKRVLVSQIDNYRYRCREWKVPQEVTEKLKVTLGGKDFYWPSLQYVYGCHTTGQESVSSRVEHKAELNSGLRGLNLLEYTRHVRIEKMPTHPELSSKKLYYFNLDHPLTFTHVQVLDPKHKVVILAGKPPKLPKTEEDRKVSQSSLDKYGRYMGTLLCPWDEQGRCNVETWDDFNALRNQWVDRVTRIVESDRDWERHCVVMNNEEFIDQDHENPVVDNLLQKLENSMVLQPFPDPRPLHYLMVDKNIRLNMKTDLESALLVRKWRSRSTDKFTHAEKANASRKWDTAYCSGGDANANSANSKLLHKVLDKITSGYLRSGVNETTRQQINDLLKTLGDCFPQHLNQVQLEHDVECTKNHSLNWGIYSPTWVKNRLKTIKIGTKSTESESCQRGVGTKPDRMKIINMLRQDLSESQLICFDNAVSVMNPEDQSFTGKPLRMFVHGGPGVGKSHLIEKIKDFAKLYNKVVRCMSISGCAAKLIGGTTCHSSAALRRSYPVEGDLNEPIQRRRVQKKMRDKQQEPVWLYIIDEISMMDADLFAILSDRIGLLHSSPGSLNRKLSFGGSHVIIVGDMLQIGAVKKTSIHKDCVDMALGVLNRDSCKPRRLYGIKLFQSFQKFELKPHEHGRSQDPQQSANIKQMRDGKRPITHGLLSCYKRLSPMDVQNDSEFEFAPVLTSTNVERASVNKDAVIRYARKHGLPVLFWVDEYGTVPSAVRRRSPKELTMMSEKYFVPGAPCMITRNMQPTEITGVVNGSKGSLHSLTWSNGYEIPCTWKPGEILEVPVPSYVNVLLDKNTHKTNGGILPCGLQNGEVNVCGAKLKLKQHPVTLLFAVTPFKVQGQTTPRMILDLRYKEGTSLTNLGFEELYVAISRIKCCDHLRVLISDDNRIDHITNLRRPTYFSQWMECYGDNGMFNGRRLRQLGREQRSQSLKTVKSWSRQELSKQPRSRLWNLIRNLGLQSTVKRTGRGNQPLKSDMWNVLFPIWREGNPNRSNYKSRQETLHDQNLETMKKPGKKSTSRKAETKTDRRSPRHPSFCTGTCMKGRKPDLLSRRLSRKRKSTPIYHPTSPMTSTSKLSKMKTPPRNRRHVCSTKDGPKSSPVSKSSTKNKSTGNFKSFSRGCVRRLRFRPKSPQENMDVRLDGGCNMDSSVGYMSIAKGLFDLKICDCPYQETGRCSCLRGICPTIGLHEPICRRLMRLGTRAKDIVKQCQRLDRQSRSSTTSWCQRLNNMGWDVDNVLIVDHLGSGIWDSHSRIKQWFQNIGIPENLIGYSLADRNSSYCQEFSECGINVGIFGKHFILNNTMDPTGIQHTRSRRRELIHEANQLYGRLQIDNTDVLHKDATVCSRFLSGSHIQRLCDHWGIPDQRWHGSCALDQMPETIVRGIFLNPGNIGIEGCDHVVHGLSVNTSYTFQRGFHWIGVFIRLRRSS